MTDEELKAIEDEGCGCVIASGYGCAAEALVAEVRRLRGVIALVQDRNEYLRSHGRDACPWCGGDVNNEHDDGSQSGYACPAFTPDGKVR